MNTMVQQNPTGLPWTITTVEDDKWQQRALEGSANSAKFDEMVSRIVDDPAESVWNNFNPCERKLFNHQNNLNRTSAWLESNEFGSLEKMKVYNQFDGLEGNNVIGHGRPSSDPVISASMKYQQLLQYKLAIQQNQRLSDHNMKSMSFNSPELANKALDSGHPGSDSAYGQSFQSSRSGSISNLSNWSPPSTPGSVDYSVFNSGCNNVDSNNPYNPKNKLNSISHQSQLANIDLASFDLKQPYPGTLPSRKNNVHPLKSALKDGFPGQDARTYNWSSDVLIPHKQALKSQSDVMARHFGDRGSDNGSFTGYADTSESLHFNGEPFVNQSNKMRHGHLSSFNMASGMVTPPYSDQMSEYEYPANQPSMDMMQRMGVYSMMPNPSNDPLMFSSQFAPEMMNQTGFPMVQNARPQPAAQMLDPTYIASFNQLWKKLRPRTGPAGELHLRLEECCDQFRMLERERKMFEADLPRMFPGRKLNSQNTIQIPRLPNNPSHVDRLIVDMLREHSRVITLAGKVEKLREGFGKDGLHHNIMSTLELWKEGIRKVQARRKDEIVNATNRQRHGGPRTRDDRDILALAKAIQELMDHTKRARNVQWCSLQSARDCFELTGTDCPDLVSREPDLM